MAECEWYTGDAAETIRREIEPGSVDLVLTSPPFLALRSYLDDDDPAKADEIGAESTPGEFLDNLLDVVEACAGVMSPHATLAIELGDSYSGSGGGGGDYTVEGGKRVGQNMPRHSAMAAAGDGWPEKKSLVLAPELLRVALAYGRNPLTGRETHRWRVRNVVRWTRPNPKPGSLGGKFRPASSDMVVASLSPWPWFDELAVRRDGHLTDWWAIPTASGVNGHYATWPDDLVYRAVGAWCPYRVCTACGAPQRRRIERVGESASYNEQTGKREPISAVYDHVGWESCECDAHTRVGRVLDPFAGSGTTPAIAVGMGRDAVGIDLDAKNAVIAAEQVGPMLFHHHRAREVSGVE